MTIETYYNFVKIIECGNILAASQELMIAQPALSTQLKNLENTLDVRLVERGAKKISLTPAGEIFYKKAQAICALDTSMHEELQNYMHGIEGTLKLSMTPSNPPSLLHFLFDSFVEAHPNVNFEFHEALSPQIADYVRTGISEIGITRSVIKNADDFHSIPFRTEEIKVIVSENHPLPNTILLHWNRSKMNRLLLQMSLRQELRRHLKPLTVNLPFMYGLHLKGLLFSGSLPIRIAFHCCPAPKMN